MMLLLEHNGSEPADDLAIDEALLEQAEHRGQPMEVLRLWEPLRPAVVMGRSSSVEREVNLGECRRRGVPIVRRSSGGAAVVIGPGCLMYSVVLSYRLRPALRAIDLAHRYVLAKVAGALRPLVSDVDLRGTSDLALAQRKISGNSVRCKRDHLLYHGTLLYDFPLELLSACLTMPPRQPEYREGRGHLDFVTNVPVSPDALRSALRAAWQADEPYEHWPAQRARQLASEKYSQHAWTFGRSEVESPESREASRKSKRPE